MTTSFTISELLMTSSMSSVTSCSRPPFSWAAIRPFSSDELWLGVEEAGSTDRTLLKSCNTDWQRWPMSSLLISGELNKEITDMSFGENGLREVLSAGCHSQRGHRKVCYFLQWVTIQRITQVVIVTVQKVIPRSKTLRLIPTHSSPPQYHSWLNLTTINKN